jgi:hypothetical protein
MNRAMQPALTLYVIGLLGLVVLALVYHDFALDWEPVSCGTVAARALAQQGENNHGADRPI